jgi:hypothetical protein
LGCESAVCYLGRKILNEEEVNNNPIIKKEYDKDHIWAILDIRYKFIDI